MTLLLDVTRPLVTPAPFGVGKDREGDAPAHVLVCNDCGQEQVFAALRDVVFEPPFFWLDLGGGHHRGPCCQTKKAVERRRKELVNATVRELRSRGLTGKEIRRAGLLA